MVSAWPGRKSLDPVTVVFWLSDGKDVCSLVITPALYTVFKTLLGAADGIFKGSSYCTLKTFKFSEKGQCHEIYVFVFYTLDQICTVLRSQIFSPPLKVQ